MPDKQEMRLWGVDGIPRTEEAEAALDQAVHACLTSPSGTILNLWLRAITLDVVTDPDCSDQELRYQEGMRRLYAMMAERRRRHEKRSARNAE